MIFILKMEDEKKKGPKIEIHQSGESKDYSSESECELDSVPMGKGQSFEEQNTPKIIKKLHRRQVSSASAKMFALNDEMCFTENAGIDMYSEEISRFDGDKNNRHASKEVRFRTKKSDDGISRSIVRSDVEGTLHTELTTVSNQRSTEVETNCATTSTATESNSETSQQYHLKGILSCISNFEPSVDIE